MKLPVFIEALSQVLPLIEATDAAAGPVALEAACERLLGWVRDVRGRGRKVIFLGNGGSAAIASHQAVDYWKNGGVRAVAFNDASMLTCIANDFGFEHVFAKPLEMFADAGDLTIAISSSGRSADILNGVAAGRARGCQVVTLSGFAPGNPLRRLGDLNFYVPADSYGLVEISHLAICHGVVEQLMVER